MAYLASHDTHAAHFPAGRCVRHGDAVTTEVWFRNPNNFIREMVDTAQCLVAWDRGTLAKRKIDPIAHAGLYFGKAHPWRALAIGAQGAAEYRDGDTEFSPTAVYPVWAYGESVHMLEELMDHPIGEDVDICNDESMPGDERPVLGQEHRVIITNIPPVHMGPGRSFLAYLKELQEEYPKAILHVHGLYSYRGAFGMNFGAADNDPRTTAQKGKVVLPTGKEVLFERVADTPQWARILGFKPVELNEPRNRCMFNIRSAVWAGENFAAMYSPRSIAGPAIDPDVSDDDFKAVETRTPLPVSVKAKTGDKVSCDTCSLQDKCSHFRSGAVCSVPGAETKSLATMFKTRDSSIIIDGLGTLAAANARRLERGMREEEIHGDLNPEVSKIMGQVFDQGTKLAKLIDPELRSGAKVQVNVGVAGSPQVQVTASPRALVADAIRTLQDQGIERSQITPDMVKGLLEGMNNPGRMQLAAENLVIEQ